MKIVSAIMGTIYPLSCLCCDASLAFSFEVLCKECLGSLCWDEDSHVTLSQDIVTEKIVKSLYHAPSKRLYDFVASLMILKMAQAEIDFESIAALSDRVSQRLGKAIAKKLKFPLSKKGDLCIALEGKKEEGYFLFKERRPN